MEFLTKILGKDTQEDAIPAAMQAGAREFVDRVAPEALLVEQDTVVMPAQGVLTRTWWVEDLPPSMTFESLDALLQFPGRVTVSMLAQPIAPGDAMQALRQHRSSQVAGFITRGQQGRLSEPSAMADLASAESELADLQIRRRFPLSLYWTIGLSAHDDEELEDLSQKVEELLLTSGLIFHRATWRQEPALKSLLPLGVNFLGDSRNANANTMATLFPFSRRLWYEPAGIPYGIDRYTGAWVLFNEWSQDNQNMLVVGKMGSGKSMFLKWKTLWHILLGGRAYLIDLEGEFSPLAQLLGAECIDMGLASEEKLNVLDLNPEDEEGYYSGANDLLGWLGIAVGGYTPHEKNAVMDAYRRIMGEAGVYQDDRASWRAGPGQMPLLSDLYSALLVEENAAARDVAARLREYAIGMYSDAYNARTTIDPQSPLVVFDVSRVKDETQKALRLRQIVTFIWARMMRGDVPTLVITDEAWHWLRHPAAAGELEAMGRRFRKRFGGLQLATQHPHDLTATLSAQVIQETADIAVLFQQKGSAVGALASLFDLNALEAEELRTLSPGDALLVTPDERIPLYVAIPPELLKIFSTRPQEMAEGL
jgi:type IV secretory pathway VirB4 component